MIFGPFKRGPFPSADEDAFAAQLRKETPQTRTPSYKLAFQDDDFLLREELRPVRLQLELLKPELLMREQNIDATVVIYGSARVPEPAQAQEMLCAAEAELEKTPDNPKLQQRAAAARSAVRFSRYYDEARTLGRLISTNCQLDCEQNLVVMTGGGPGIMEAANRGAYDVDAQTIGLNIVLPFEQAPNPYITPDLSFQFHYFAIRKMHLLMRAKGLVAFPGGFGTMDELFETLTLIQTGKVEPIPVLLFGRDFWSKVINFDALVEAGTIAARDLKLFQYVETAEEAWTILAQEIGRNGKRDGKQVTKAEM
ncbi:hypothetical protein PCS_01609 [Desulfocurvibacter africanus PCS]|uniref:AMP nucleosidase n=1 Tax=Desulfocurvibacter africanus PCS TaxID=1262666 RepID=M5PTJ0_DESAF|nr:TIGR00730 family Rossman fold protein [Desulfocurvibacter africanus]EMG37667.1 hypothetical protein PCS_01609 [Desulfocurvibacter africanus PCS]